MGSKSSKKSVSRLARLSQHVKMLSTSGDMEKFSVVVIGGGNAAGYLANGLVESGFTGSVAILSREPSAPYERPALTKAFLHPMDAKVRARLPGFHTCVGGGGDRHLPDWYAANNISLKLSTHATKLNTAEKSVIVKDKDGKESTVHYDKLVLATGARALTHKDIRMENPQVSNVFTIREEKECLEMVKAFESGAFQKVAVVGGGYIGMEVSAALIGWGLEVTMVFPDSHLMTRLFPDQIAQVFESNFAARGIKITKKGAVGFVGGAGDKVKGIVLSDGTQLEADAVVVGIGSRLNLELLEGNDIEMAQGRMGGVKVDDNFQTSDPSVYAIGDIAAVHGEQRFEHVDFCRKSAAQAARALAGSPSDRFEYLPYFYSRLFEYSSAPVVFQFYGNNNQSADVEVFGAYADASVCKADEKLPVFGALWHSAGKVEGIMLCNASANQYELAKQSIGAAQSAELIDRLLEE